MTFSPKDLSCETKAPGISRRTFVAQVTAGSVTLAANKAMGKINSQDREPILENEFIRIVFTNHSGSLAEITNKLTKEIIGVQGDRFEIVAEEFKLSPLDLRLASVRKTTNELVEVVYERQGLQIIVKYRLGIRDHFLEKSLSITSESPYRLKSLSLIDLSFSGPKFAVIE